MRPGPALCAALLLLTVGAERTHLLADLPEKSERVVTYNIRATLEPEPKEVRAEMDLVWRNTAGKPVDHLYFHLYLNAFRDRDSTYMRESAGRGKSGAKFDKEYPGWVQVDRMKLADGTDLNKTGACSFVAPDDGNEKDRTLLRVALPAPVPPGETLALDIAFRSRLPRVLHRTGWAGDPNDPDDLFFMVAQWFPKVAVLRQTKGGELLWNAHQFHKSTEFFADYGEYTVSLTVPAGYVVGATGVASAPVANDDGTITVTYVQKDVHDFAWTASPHFGVEERVWTFDSFCDQAPGAMGERIRELLARTAEHRGVALEAIKPAQSVNVRLLYQPDHRGVVDRLWQAAGASLCCYGTWFGQYPYEVLTVVAPPAGGGAAGGMEYPTLITIWGDRYAPDYATGMEGVTIHEFGHQFFYGLIGTNEFEEAWLDEGFTSYTDARVFEVAYGPRTTDTRYGPMHTPFFRPFEAPSIYAKLRGLFRVGSALDKLPHPWRRPESLLPVPSDNPFWTYLRDMPYLHLDGHVPFPAPSGERRSWLQSGTRDAMVMPGWHFATRGDYRVNSYPKPTLFLYCLRGLMGEAAFDRAMYDYAEKYRFKHPGTDDFLAEVRAAAPEKQRALVDGFLHAMIETSSRLDAAILSVEQRKVGKGKERERWEWTVRVQRRGTIPVPIAVLAQDEQGGVELLDTWTSRDRETTRTFRVLRDRRLHTVRLGPEWLWILDEDSSNNAYRVERDALPAETLAARWTLFVEEAVRSYARVDR